MKLVMFFLTAACITAGATGNSQGVTMSMKNAPLEKVFTTIEKQAGFYFTYTKELLQGTRNVDVNVKNASIKDVMDICVKDQPITYELIDKAIIIKKRSAVTLSNVEASSLVIPPINIHGRVVNEKGEPVAGVTVTVKETNKRTATNDNGEFTLKEVEDNATLLFTSVNMETFEVKVDGSTELTINLKTKITALGEVSVQINTGYQQINRERFVGSYSQMDSGLYHRRVGMNIIDRLEGNVPSLFFNKKAGTAPLQIRGISSINANKDPLIVLDNFPLTGTTAEINAIINNINPNEIENISILKDAAAASIWGTRAGNGVIVITTRRAKFNQPIRISVSSNVTIGEKPNLFYFPQMSSSDFIDVEQFLFSKQFLFSDTSSRTRPLFSPVYEILFKQRRGEITAAEAKSQIDALRQLDVRNDYEKYVYQESVSQQHFINFSGGSNLMNYTFSAGYNHSNPNIKGSKGDDQYTLNSQNSFRPVKNLEFTAGINYTRGINKSYLFPYPISPNGGKSAIYPYAQLANDQGNPLAIPYFYRLNYIDTVGSGQLLDWHYRPLDEVKLADNKSITEFIRLNLGASYRFTNWLSVDVKYQYLNQTGNTKNHYSQKTFFTRNLINALTNLSQSDPALRYPIPLGGILDAGNSTATSQYIRGQLNFNESWKGRNEIVALVAAETTERQSELSSNRLYGYNNELGTFANGLNYLNFYPVFNRITGPAFSRIDAGVVNSPGIFNRLVSFLANASYTRDNKYTFYASARRDGANVFGVNTNNKWKPLWSVGASWDIAKEGFYSVSWLPSLRLKGSYGYSGNVNNGFSGLATIIYSDILFLFTTLPTAVVSSPPNPDLRWEKVKMLNIGLEFSALKNRLSGVVEWFHKKSEDLLAPTVVDPTTGVNTLMVNIANLKGQGYEISLNSLNTTGAIQWRTGFNLSHNKTIVTKYQNGGFRVNQFSTHGINPSEGELAWGISSYRWAGLDPLTGNPQGYFGKEVSQDYIKILSDSVKNQVFHGSSIPLYFGFLNNAISWKNFTVSANVSYKFDYYFRKNAINYTSLFNNWIGHSDYASRWQKPGDEKWTTVPSMNFPSDSRRDQFYAFSEVNVEKGDHVRLQDISLSYSWNNRNSMRLPFKNIQFSLYANNLNIILWKAYKSGLDPDYTAGSLQLPPVRTWTGGITVNF